MAIVSCKECEGKVSTKADACPHCGAKQRVGLLEKGTSAILDMLSEIALWVLKVVLILAGIYFVIGLLLTNLWENIKSVLSF